VNGISLVYLLISLKQKNFMLLTRGDIIVFIFIVGIAGLCCVQYALALSLRFRRLQCEKRKGEQGFQRILGRKKFYETLKQELRRAGRYHLPISLCLFDLDDFKSICENQGRAFANDLSHSFAELVVGAIRSSDYMGCHGEARFCILLCHTDLGQADNFFIRMLLQSQERLDVSFSAGLTAYRIGENADEFLKRVEDALAYAKREGHKKARCSIGKDDSCNVKLF